MEVAVEEVVENLEQEGGQLRNEGTFGQRGREGVLEDVGELAEHVSGVDGETVEQRVVGQQVHG